jgi:hypothetical protein
MIVLDSPAFYPRSHLWKYPEVTHFEHRMLLLYVASHCAVADTSTGILLIPFHEPIFLTSMQLHSISLSNNSFGRIHLVAEMFDIVLRCNYNVHTLWCNNNVFTGMQLRQRFAANAAKSPEEESYIRTTLNAARSKLQAAVHVYVNEHINPKSKTVKVIPDPGEFPPHFHMPSSHMASAVWADCRPFSPQEACY